MSNSTAALFQRLTQGVYWSAWPMGDAQRFHRSLGDAGFFQSLAAGLEHQPATFVLWPAEAKRRVSVNVLKKSETEMAAHSVGPPTPTNWPGLMDARPRRYAIAA